jgi:hypothetical protein
VGSPGGAGCCRGGGVAHQLTPCRAGVSTRGTRSHRLRQPVGLLGTVWARVQRGRRGACRADRCAPPRIRSGSAAAQALLVARLVPVRSVSGLPLAWAQRPAAGALDRTGTPGVGSPGGAGGWRAGGVAAQLTPGRNGGHQGKPVAPFPAKGGAFRGAVRACAVAGAVAQSVARSRSKGSRQRSQPIGARPVAGLLARRRRREKEGFYICE